MTRIQALFEDYASYHRNPRNKACHFIGIPMIMFSLIDMSYGAIGLLVLAYFYWELRLGLAMLATAAGMAGLSWLLISALGPWHFAVSGALFVLGWIIQVVGHAFEGNRPALMTNVVHFLVGPAWIANKILGIVPAPAAAAVGEA